MTPGATRGKLPQVFLLVQEVVGIDVLRLMLNEDDRTLAGFVLRSLSRVHCFLIRV